MRELTATTLFGRQVEALVHTCFDNMGSSEKEAIDELRRELNKLEKRGVIDKCEFKDEIDSTDNARRTLRIKVWRDERYVDALITRYCGKKTR